MISPILETYFAPAERMDPEALHRERDAFLASPFSKALLDAVPEIILVLNKQRQIIAMNAYACQVFGVSDVDEVLGMRPGEAVACIHADECASGCGTSPFCFSCGAVRSIMDCLETGQPTAYECRILTRQPHDGGALNLHVQSTLVPLGDTEVVVMVMRDISAQKRRDVLERVFLHDLSNTINNICGLTHLLALRANHLDAETLRYQLDRLSHFAQQVAEEVSHHRQLVAAENGDLKLSLERISVPALLEELLSAFANPKVAHGRLLSLRSPGEGYVVSDAVLLRRVLGNLLTNALEATPPGGVVTLAGEVRDGEVRFLVHNPGCIAHEVQAQIFQRAYSTKAGSGRGIGTYSVKLLGERYLGGRVTFTSSEAEGTTFTFVLPTTPPPHGPG
ncbi:MAG: PAS domain-containing protein [Armatimonadetes bacterium]|jgi:nitrogen fixation/metabolism regulation signal transduction histidine kinase|nr:PAS domain-containing protein [Armatimonadota bacterium]